MRIKSLSLTNFRAFSRLEIEFSSHLNLFIGRNAQGKTTILEAIHLLSLMTSPLAGNDREIINFLALKEEVPLSRIVALIERSEKNHRIEFRAFLTSGNRENNRLKKELVVDGVQRRPFDFVGFFNSTLFLPQMTRIIESGPDERRKYFDQVISQVIPGYLKSLSNYLKGIVKRNALLKQLNEKGGDPDQLVYWDDLIASNGAEIIISRIAALREINKIANQHHLEITEKKEQLKIEYLPSLYLSPKDGCQIMNETETIFCFKEDIKEKILGLLRSRRREEIARGVTTIGPHRDEFRFIVNGADIGTYGSRGQIRTAVLALKFSEKDWFKEKTGELPVILLDETLAELDTERRKELLATLDNGGQAVLTTADLELFDESFIHRCYVWRVEQGRITQEGF